MWEERRGGRLDERGRGGGGRGGRVISLPLEFNDHADCSGNLGTGREFLANMQENF